jgi:DNA polymerase-3 subunit beta
MFVRVGNYELAVKTIDAQFPAYNQVIPKDHRKLATVDRKLLIAALKRTKPLALSTRGVALSLHGDKLTITADHPDLGKAVETLDAETCSDAKYGVNPSYLLDAVEEIDDERVTIAFGAELDPILVRGTGQATSKAIMESSYLAVVMPMRI